MTVDRNVAVVQGRLSRAPKEVVLPSGDRIFTFEVSVRRDYQERAESVPVQWPQAPARAIELEAGTAVFVLGRIRRRFFRAGGFTESRTEVVAEAVVPVRAAKRVDALLAKARGRLDV
jgi:single-strand DNA-binding protein